MTYGIVYAAATKLTAAAVKKADSCLPSGAASPWLPRQGGRHAVARASDVVVEGRWQLVGAAKEAVDVHHVKLLRLHETTGVVQIDARTQEQGK